MKKLMLTILLLCCVGSAAPAEELPAFLDMNALLTQHDTQSTLNTPGRERCGKEGCYWETPMDPTDEAACWAMLTAPMTVIQGDPRSQVALRAEPDENSPAIGEVTCASQGVHVLEQLDNGWSRIEC